MFMSYLNSNKVILYNLKYVNKFYKNIFDSLNDVIYVETEVNESKKDLFKTGIAKYRKASPLGN